MADSNITKKALATELKELMKEIPFSRISVSDICDRCNMNRKSFYYHFRDKYDLINWIFDTEFISVLQTQERQFSWDTLNALCIYFYENHDFYRKVLSVTGQNSFAQHFHDVMFSAIRTQIIAILGTDKTSEFQVNFFTDAFVMTIHRWILEKDCIPPKEFMKQMKLCVEYLVNKYNDFSELI